MLRTSIISSIVLSLAVAKVAAQNLVPNPSFEDTLGCATGLLLPGESYIEIALPWFNATGGSSDFISSHNCGGSNLYNMPLNFIGYQNARTGVAYAHSTYYMTLPNDTFFREFISVQLLDTLIADRSYCVEFYISLADSSRYSLAKIGAYFSQQSPTSSGADTLNYLPQVTSPPNVYMSDTVSWMLIQGQFVANGNEQFLTIGNFGPRGDDTLFNPAMNQPVRGAFYYIDDVFVGLMGPEPVTNAGTDISLCLDSTQQATIGAPAIAGYQYAWQVAAGIVDTTLAEQTVSPTTTTTYYLWVTDTTDTTTTCEAWAMDSVTVYVVDCDTIPPPEPPDNYAGLPNIFSPNGDGANDELFVRGTNINTIDLHVFNRWGEEVFASADVNAGWDGTYKGEPVNAGVYVYWCRVIYTDGSEEVLKGNVTLIR